MFEKSEQAAFWNFSPIPNIEESNFNKVLERFYGLGIKGLTKENIQNSLDGRLKDCTLPVVVTIKLGTIDQSDIPGIEDVKAHIKSLKGRNSYTVETIDHMVKHMDKEQVRYVSFEDLNTRGLTGAKNGQSNSKEDTWGIYAYNKGVHFEEKDESFETTRGGSHGIGKIASNAASDLHVMYFANCDEKQDQHLGGTVQLIEHEFEGQCYRSSGYFAKVEHSEGQSKFYPYENEFHEVFQKNERGLKIIIPFLRKEFDDEDEIIKTICDNFFVSILQGNLEVNVNDHQLTKATIHTFIENPRYYEQSVQDIKKVFTPLYFKTYLQQQPKMISVNNGEVDFEFQLYFTYNEAISKGRVGIVRTIGMKIEDFKVKANATKPFNAVLIGGLNEDKYLKSLENESHTEISSEHIKDAKLKTRATRFINNLSKEIAKIIDEEMRNNNPTDEEMDTGDLIYLMESQFKSDLEKAMGSVKIQNGKSILKAATNTQKEKKEKGTQAGTVKTEKTEVKRVPKKTQSGDQSAPDETDEAKETYRVNPNTVERVIIQNTEHLQFLFTANEEMKKVKNCNITMRIIDGMGEEFEDSFSLVENYIQIVDVLKGTACNIANNKITGVTVQKGLIKLKMNVHPGFNDALKFIYYVEV